MSNIFSINRSVRHVDARDFVTDYSGFTVQRDQLQRAFDYADRIGVPSVYLGESGTVRLSDSGGKGGAVIIPSSVTEVYGGGRDQITLLYDDRAASYSSGRPDALKTDIDGYTGTHLYIHDFKIVGARDLELDQTVGKQAFGFNATNGGTSIHLERVNLSFCRNQAMTMTKWKNVEVNNCKLWYNGRGGIGTRDCSSIHIHTNSIYENADDAIFAFQTDNGTATTQTYGVNIHHNFILQSKGIRCFSVKGLNVSNNIIIRPVGFGIMAGNNYNVGTEGNIGSVAVNISHNVIQDALKMTALEEGYGQGDMYMLYESNVNTAGTGLVAPLRNDTSTGKVVLPNKWFYEPTARTDPALSDTGSYDVNIEGNQLICTLEAGMAWADFSDYEHWSNNGNKYSPVLTDAILACDGLQLSGQVTGLHVHGGTIRPGKDAYVIRHKNADFDFCIMDTLVDGVVLARGVNLPCFSSNASGGRAADLTFQNCVFDVDPYMESSGRNTDGSWDTGTLNSSALGIAGLEGVMLRGNTFKNCYQPVQGGIQSHTALDNTLICDPVATGWHASNKGIGVVPVGSRSYYHLIVNSNPSDADFRKVIRHQLITRTSKPTAGTYVEGHFIENESPTVLNDGSDYLVRGWKRLTTGTAHVTGTDWVEIKDRI